MCKLIISLFFALFTLNQFGSIAGSQNNPSSMCISINKTIECGKFVSKFVLPLYGEQQQNNFKKLNENLIMILLKEIQHERESRENTNKALRKLIPQDLDDRLAKIDSRQQLLQNSLEIQHKIAKKNSEIHQIGILNMIKTQLNTIKESIPQDIEQSLANIKAQGLTLQKDIQFQLTKISKILSKIEARQRFKAIGLKFYYIEDNVTQNWTTAAQSCRQMGGNLASIQNDQEFQAIKKEINSDNVYWVDINDHERKGKFISVASGKRVTFFKWLPDEPRYDDETQRYVNLFNGGMRVENGSNKRNFICQYYDEDDK